VNRREFITLLGGATVVWPLAAPAQQAVDAVRLGVLTSNPDNPGAKAAFPHFLSELSKLGFSEGRNLLVEFRRIDQGVPQAFAGANELPGRRMCCSHTALRLLWRRQPLPGHRRRSSFSR
jgi:hypothetical protein